MVSPDITFCSNQLPIQTVFNVIFNTLLGTGAEIPAAPKEKANSNVIDATAVDTNNDNDNVDLHSSKLEDQGQKVELEGKEKEPGQDDHEVEDADEAEIPKIQVAAAASDIFEVRTLIIIKSYRLI